MKRKNIARHENIVEETDLPSTDPQAQLDRNNILDKAVIMDSDLDSETIKEQSSSIQVKCKGMLNTESCAEQIKHSCNATKPTPFERAPTSFFY